jgi:hypothetical protein
MEIESRALSMLGKCSTIKLQTTPALLAVKNHKLKFKTANCHSLENMKYFGMNVTIDIQVLYIKAMKHY